MLVFAIIAVIVNQNKISKMQHRITFIKQQTKINPLDMNLKSIILFLLLSFEFSSLSVMIFNIMR